MLTADEPATDVAAIIIRDRRIDWLLAAFLLGIAAHSFWPHAALDLRWFLLAVIISVAIGMLASPRRWRTFAFGALMLLAGLWRFDMLRSSLSPSVQPFSPKGLVHQTNVPPHDPADPFYWAGRARADLHDRAQRSFPGDEGALLTDILYGDHQLSKPTKELFRRAGLMHIIAVSGSNVTILLALLLPTLNLLRCSRRRSFAFASVALALFILFVNPSASVIRAALMGWLIQLGPILGRATRPSRTLLLSAAVFTAWKPWALLFDASFALTFLALWGLLSWSPLIYRWLPGWIPGQAVRQIIAMTLGATLMTMPYSAWLFGEVTLLGLVSCNLVLPLIPWVTATGALSLLLPQLYPLQLITTGFLRFILFVAQLSRILPWAVFLQLTPSWWFMAGAYACLFALWHFFGKILPAKFAVPNRAVDLF